MGLPRLQAQNKGMIKIPKAEALEWLQTNKEEE
jgi:hypothetical protein